jgi:hypothetical protein
MITPVHRRDCVVPRDGLALDTRCTCGLRDEVLTAYTAAQVTADETDFQAVMARVAVIIGANLGAIAVFLRVGCGGAVVLGLLALLGLTARAWRLL